MNKTPLDVKKSRWKKYFGRFTTVHGIAEMAVLVAAAIVLDLDFAKISFGAGSGQSISITMLPLIIIALRFPVLDSLIGIGIVYGVTTNLIDSAGLHTYPLDYLMGYGSLALIALFRGQIFTKNRRVIFSYLFLGLAITVGVVARIFWSTMSGIVNYATPFWGSLTYNAPQILLSGLICLILLIMLFQTLVVLNKKVEPYFETEESEEIAK